MPGAMRKLGLYLGLVEDDEDIRHDDHAGFNDANDRGHFARHAAR